MSERSAAYRMILLVTLVAILATGVAYASSTSKGKAISVSTPLSTGSVAAAGAKCPSNMHATGGGLAVVTGFDPAANTGTQTYPQTNYPPGKAKWRAGASSPNGEPPAELRTFVRCEKKSFGKIAKRVSHSTTLASGIGRTVSVVCPSDTQVLGGGYSVSPQFDASAPGNSTSRLVVLQSRRSSDLTWTVSATNPNQPTTQLTVAALCEKNGRDISTKTSFSPLPDKSRQALTAKCSKKQHVVAGGFAVTPPFSNAGIPVTDVSAPSDSRSWKVEVYGRANIPTSSGITSFAYCKSNKPPESP
jgi:hypothetical protein